MNALDTLTPKLVPYLFPFVIEFVLMCAASMYKIFLQVGFPACALSKEKRDEGIHWKHMLQRTKQLLPSLIIGFILLGGTIACTVWFIYLNEQSGYESRERAAKIYFSTDIFLNALGIVIFSYGFSFLLKFPFSNHLENALDQSLVIATMGGLLLLIAFQMMPAVDGIWNDGLFGLIAKLGITSNVLTYVQVVVQFLYIMDGLRREKASEFSDEKLGPSIIIIGTSVNFCLWILSSFLVKHTRSNPLLRDYYGVLMWTIALYVCLPLAVFFRFHCCVCLSDIFEDLCM